MSLHLLERERFLDDLAGQLDQVAGGGGRCVLLSGEAGIGKSALIEGFAEQHGASARFCWGRCEALFTPRPLGPLHDIARQLGGRLADVLEHEASRTAIFSAFLEALSDSPTPTAAVIEDVHWADEATLDLLKFVGRRVQQVPVLLIITYRDEEIGPEHPLWFVLGDLPSRVTRRLLLPPLSRDAVAALAGEAGRSNAALYEVTGGNPFFVTEVLASDAEGVPESVRAAVLARAARLSQQGRALLDLVSVVPARAEAWLIETTVRESASAIAECIGAGVLRPEADAVAFRHELARQAVESTLPPLRARELHRAVLHALMEHGHAHVEIARLVHHAALAGDGAAVLQYAPAAAKQAAQQGAHREAAMHYKTALRCAESLSPAEQAALLDGLAYECYLTGQLTNATQAQTDALTLWRAAGEDVQVGRGLRWLSRLHWYLGDRAVAERYAMEAIAALEALPPGTERAMAYSNLAQLCMLKDDVPGAERWGTKAVELAGMLGDDEILTHALNNIGTAQFMRGDEEGHARLEVSLQLALAHGFEEHAARAYTNLGTAAMRVQQHARAARYFDDGILYCAERGLDLLRHCATGSRARVRLATGDWAGAADDATEVLASYQVSPIGRIQAQVALAWVRMRRGDPGSAPLLDDALELALKTGEPEHIVPVAAARAEAAWLRGDLAVCQAEAHRGYERTLERATIWDVGQLYFWMWKSGSGRDLPPELPEPYRLQCTGDWRSAAAAWERTGCPYERALALADGDAGARRAALRILDGLGASATIHCLRRQHASSGAAGFPRGPRRSTRSNPAGLTNQQMEVLHLMADGLRNGEIAAALHLSPKTVEHHVSAVLSKLNARTRAQAVTHAYTRGVIAKTRVSAK